MIDDDLPAVPTTYAVFRAALDDRGVLRLTMIGEPVASMAVAEATARELRTACVVIRLSPVSLFLERRLP